jgi:hypothetical protein
MPKLFRRLHVIPKSSAQCLMNKPWIMKENSIGYLTSKKSEKWSFMRSNCKPVLHLKPLHLLLHANSSKIGSLVEIDLAGNLTEGNTSKIQVYAIHCTPVRSIFWYIDFLSSPISLYCGTIDVFPAHVSEAVPKGFLCSVEAWEIQSPPSAVNEY